MLLNAIQRQAILSGFALSAPYDGDDILALGARASQMITYENYHTPNGIIICNSLIDFVGHASDEWLAITSIKILLHFKIPFHMTKHAAFGRHANRFHIMMGHNDLWVEALRRSYPTVLNEHGWPLTDSDYTNAVAMRLARCGLVV